jgi:hypothetical protein
VAATAFFLFFLVKGEQAAEEAFGLCDGGVALVGL